MSALRDKEPPDDFVDEFCRLGTGMLSLLESGMGSSGTGDAANSPPGVGEILLSQLRLNFSLALFKTRRSGHARPQRRFVYAGDFIRSGVEGKTETIVPGIHLQTKDMRKGVTPIVQLIRRKYECYHHSGSHAGAKVSLTVDQLRTTLDETLVQGVYRDIGNPKALGFPKIIELIAPALIAGIEVNNDSLYLVEHNSDYKHFLTRLARRYFKKSADFDNWVRVESEKGFVRLLPGFKQIKTADRDAAREKGRRFYRRTLWTAHEVVSRCYGAAALWVWMSFCESKVMCPSLDEQHAFRWYNSPLVCAGGMPLWFFGPNVLQWIIEPFIERVWGMEPDHNFDDLTRLIALYGGSAAERRKVDTDKKRKRRPAASSKYETVPQLENTSDGESVGVRVNVVQPKAPRDAEGDSPMASTDSQVCPRCGDRMYPASDEASGNLVKPYFEGGELVATIECVHCAHPLQFRCRM